MVNVLIKEILDDDMSIRVRETWMPKWTEIAGLRKDKGRHFFLFTVRIKMPYPKEHHIHPSESQLFAQNVYPTALTEQAANFQ